MTVSAQNQKAAFSVKEDSPFMVFQNLQDIARRERGEDDVIDLSRGDPGYGFTPSIRGRNFAGYILHLDTVLNSSPEDRFLQYKEEDAITVLQRIEAATGNAYTEEMGNELSALLHLFMNAAIGAAKEEGKEWTAFTVLRELFSYSAMTGGSYLKPQGQDLTRVIVADWHRKQLGVNIQSEDVILTSGASHAMGTIFKALGSEGRGYLQAGDTICISSPVYSPYNSIMEERGMHSLPLSIDPCTGQMSHEDMKKLRTTSAQIKALFLIDPNNPTGFSLPESEVEALAHIAKERDLFVITDEVYSSFFPQKKTMLSFCPERTLCINARSKIERSTGLRFGEIIVLKEGREYIAGKLSLKNGDELMRTLHFAKGPGSAGGQLQHTTFVPGPAQLIGISHMVLGAQEREAYTEGLRANMEIFCKELSLKNEGNLYYIIFDLNDLPGCTTKNVSIEERLLKLAEAGVVFIPAYQFFAEKDRKNPSVLTSVRASVVNTTPERLLEALKRVKEVLC